MAKQTNKVLKHPTHTTDKTAQEACEALSLSQAARQFDVPKSTLRTRLQNVQDQALFDCSLQKLTPEEEFFLVHWVLQLQA